MRRNGDRTARRPVVAAAAALCLAAGAAATAVQPAAPSGGRAVVVIGDLHMGPGRDGARWNAVEDFRWGDEFAAFLKAIDAEGAGATDLVLNGDTFELLQSPAVSCRHGDAQLGCTEAQALARLETVITGHGPDLQAIGAFARSGANRVHLLAGDHDAALAFDSVRARAVRAFGAPDGRIQFVEAAGWRSADARIYVEHGHQLPLGADRFAGWPKPLVSSGGRNHVERPWGEQVMLPLYDRTEPRYPVVDNIVEEGIGGKYIVAAEGADPPEGVPALLRYFLTKTTWQQFRMDLDDGEVRAPRWDMAAIRRDPSAFLASSLPPDDPFAPLAAKAAAAGHLRALDGALADEAIVAICDYRAAVRRARRRMERVLTQLSGVGPPVAECPRTADTVGPEFEDYWRSRNATFARHIAAARDRLAQGQRGAGAFEVVVFGHTHLADRPFRPGGDDGPIVAASGAWQRTIHPVALEQLAKERGVPVAALLATLQPEDLPPCYSFLRFGAAAGSRTPESRAWRRDAQGGWAMAASCGR